MGSPPDFYDERGRPGFKRGRRKKMRSKRPRITRREEIRKRQQANRIGVKIGFVSDR